MNTQSISKPGRFWYLLAALIFLASLVYGIWFMVKAISTLPDQFLSLDVPGSSEFNLTEKGQYTIYHEYRSVRDGRVLETSGSINGLTCTVTSLANGEKVPVGPSLMNETYSIGSREGVSLFNFTIDNPGIYRITAAYADGRGQPLAVLAVGQHFVGNTLKAIFVPLAVIGLGSILALAIFVAVLVKRNRQASRPDLV